MQNIYNNLFFRFLGDNIGDECDFTAVRRAELTSHVEQYTGMQIINVTSVIWKQKRRRS